MRRPLIFLLLFAPLIECFSKAFSSSSSAVTASETETFLSKPDSWDLDLLKPLWPKLENDIMLIVHFDGTIHAVDTRKKKIQWVLSSGAPTYALYQDANYFNNGSDDRFYIELGEDGALYSCNRKGKQRLSLSAEEFIRDTPRSAGDGGLTTGSKRSIAFFLDAKTGKFLSYSGETPSNLVVQNNQSDPSPKVEDADRFLLSDNVEQPLYITRTDYEVKHQYYGKVVWSLNFSAFQFDPQFSNTRKELAPKHSKVSHLPYQMRTLIPPIFGPRSIQSLSVISGLDRHAGGSSAFEPFPHDNRILIVQEFRLPPHGNDWGGNLATYLESHDLRESRSVISGPTDRHPGDSFALEPSPHDNLPAIVGESSLPHRDDEGREMLALYRETKATSVMADAVTMLRSLFLIFVTVFSIVVYRFCYPVTFGKQQKLKQVAEGTKVGVPKKKRTRRFGNNKRNSSDKEYMNMSREYKVGKSKETIASERKEKFLLISTTHVNGQIEGRRIGKLLVSGTEIAQGSNGTIVLEGTYDGRPVAVKRLVRTHHDVALKEVQNLIVSDQHPNIVRWYGVEYDQDFVYLSLERCTCSLNDLIYYYSQSIQSHITMSQDSHFLTEYTIRLHSIMESNKGIELWKANGYPSPQLLKLMSDLVSGLAHLHDLGIIHRDLKPQNVLIIKGRSLLAKLSDMGISKRLHGDKSSITQHATGYGSSGWQAPEQLLHQRQTRAVDLFSLGCLLFFCVTGGKHPYGDSIERDLNIVNDRKDLFLVDTIPEAVDLFTSLLNPNPDMRPTTTEVLHHPFFWSSETRLSFLRDASDRVELEDRETESKLLNSLEGTATVALNGKWDEKMESPFLNNIGRYRRYKFDSVRDLLRVIRNKLNHYRELPQEVQEILGPVPEGFESYFSSRFPRLFIEVYKVLYRWCKEEEFFCKYTKSNII